MISNFPTIWYVWAAKPQISLRIRAVWSEPLLVDWIFYDCQATDRTSSWKEASQGRLSLQGLSECHIVGNHMSLLNAQLAVCLSVPLQTVWTQFPGPRSGTTKCRAWSRSKLFDTLMVFKKYILEKKSEEKNQQTTNAYEFNALSAVYRSTKTSRHDWNWWLGRTTPIQTNKQLNGLC